jgi:hypothetical protein
MKHLAMIVVASSFVLAVAGIGATSAAFAAPAYELVVVPSTTTVNSPTFFRINVTSGQVVYQSGLQFVVKVVGIWSGWISNQGAPGA